MSIIGKKFHKVSVVSVAGKTLQGHIVYDCLCECGTHFIGRKYDLENENTKSCGCLFNCTLQRKNVVVSDNERRFKRQWDLLNQRCNLKSSEKYKRYGGRGIKVLWGSFDEYKKDMINLFTEHVKKHGIKNTYIERINNDGNYCKENCRFATAKEQSRNKSNNRNITYKGKTQCITDWAEELGLPMKALHLRITRSKWSIERAFNTPLLNK